MLVLPVQVSFTGTRALRLAAAARTMGVKPEELAERLADWAVANADRIAVEENPRRGLRGKVKSVALTDLRAAVVYLVAMHLGPDGVARLPVAKLSGLIAGSGAASVRAALLGLEKAGLLKRQAPATVVMPEAWRLTHAGRQVADDLGGIGFSVKKGKA
jgi:hypothetical protein